MMLEGPMLKEYRFLYEWISTTYSSGYLTEILYSAIHSQRLIPYTRSK